MRHSWVQRVVALFLILVCAGSVLAEQMTLKDLIDLKKLGYTDPQIKAALEQSGTKLKLTDADIQQLKAAGFSEELIKQLAAMAPKDLTAKDVLQMLKDGKSVEQAIDAIMASPAPINITAAEADDITRQQAPLAIVIALKGKPLGVAELKDLAKAQAPSAIYQKLAALLGFQQGALAPTDALALMRAGVPAEIITALKEGRAATRARVPAQGALAGGPESAPVDVAPVTATPPVAAQTPAPLPADLNEFRHVGHRYVLRYPKDWQLVREINKGNLIVCATPETGKQKIDDIDVSVQVMMMPLGQESVLGKDAVSMLRNVMPILRVTEPDMAVVGDVQSLKLGKMPAAKVTFKGKPKKKNATFIWDIYLVQNREVAIAIETTTPEAQHAAYQAALQRSIDSSDFGILFPSQRREKVETASNIASTYKESVVSIDSEIPNGKAFGTGFIITKDGYVVTNGHVVLDTDETYAPNKNFMAHWDQTVGRKAAKLELIGYLYARRNAGSPLNAWGIDVALMKLPPGEYKPVPLTPIGDVQNGDGVVSMGFPLQPEFGQYDIFTITGSVTRINHLSDGSIDSIYTNAKHTHGNSGGPSISQVTCGAIGLCTFSANIVPSESEEAQFDNNMVGYYGVVPAEAVLKEFPLIAELGMNPGQVTDFYDCYDLSKLFQARGSRFGAKEMALKAVQLQPRSADAHCQLAYCSMLPPSPNVDNTPTVIAEFNKALECEADHENSLVGLAITYAQGDKPDATKAIQYLTRAIQAHPESFQAYYFRSAINVAGEKFAEALADAEKAIEMSHGVTPEPYILKGKALYASGKFDEGKEAFVRAAQISPSNAEARVGAGQYFELKQNFAGALEEYQRIDADMPDTPVVMTAIARCYLKLNRTADAGQKYMDIMRRCKLVGQMPAQEVYVNLGQLLGNSGRTKSALGIYTQFLLYYAKTSEAVNVHMAAAKLIMSKGLAQGVAASHLWNARALQPNNQEVQAELQRAQGHKLSLQEINTMLLEYGYPVEVGVDMIALTPLSFRLSASDKQEWLRKGMPEGVLRVLAGAIAKSNQAFPPEGGPVAIGPTGPGPDQPANPGNKPRPVIPGDQPAGPDQPTNPGNKPRPVIPGDQPAGPDQPANPGNKPRPVIPGDQPGQPTPAASGQHPAALVGVWEGEYSARTKNGIMVQNASMTLAADGRWEYVLRSGSDAPRGKSGIWYTQGNLIAFQGSDEASASTYDYGLSGTHLTIVVEKKVSAISLEKKK